MTREEAIKYGTLWLRDEYLDVKDEAFIKIALEALKTVDGLKKQEPIIVERCCEGDHIEYDFKNERYVMVRYVRETIILPDELQQHIERLKKEVSQ
jgi:hypothetical protein